MKNPNQESKRRRRRQYHLSNPWRLSAGGLFIPHEYPKHRELSWWDDVGFIMNRRQVMVWWIHPRQKYADAIGDAAWAEAGEPPRSLDDVFASALRTPVHKRRGKSRKKVVAYTSPPMSATTRAFYDRINAIEARLTTDGIDLVVQPSMTITALDWCLGVSLCIPIEVLTEADVRGLAATARRILTGGRSLAAAGIPSDYQYGREQWQAEAAARQRDRKQADQDTL